VIRAPASSPSRYDLPAAVRSLIPQKKPSGSDKVTIMKKFSTVRRAISCLIVVGFALVALSTLPVGMASAGPSIGSHTASSPGAFTLALPAGVAVVSVRATGGAGGGAYGVQNGGQGCLVTASVAVDAQSLHGFVGANGTSVGSVTPATGGAGDSGTWSGAGGDGVAAALVGSQATGGGGSASALFDGATSTVIAAGGGGGAYQNVGGGACSSNTANGGDGAGVTAGSYSFYGGQGATSLTLATGNGQNYASGGRGGAGLSGMSPVSGGGGGGGAAGGGGGLGNMYTGGGAGLSYVTSSNANALASPTYAPSTQSPSLTVNWISFAGWTGSSDLKIGTFYAESDAATFGGQIAVTGSNASWSISPPLPGGLALDAQSGMISGTPTTESSSTAYTLTAQYLSGPLIVAESTASISLQVSGTTTSTTSPPSGGATTSTTSPFGVSAPTDPVTTTSSLVASDALAATGSNPIPLVVLACSLCGLGVVVTLRRKAIR